MDLRHTMDWFFKILSLMIFEMLLFFEFVARSSFINKTESDYIIQINETILVYFCLQHLLVGNINQMLGKYS